MKRLAKGISMLLMTASVVTCCDSVGAAEKITASNWITKVRDSASYKVKYNGKTYNLKDYSYYNALDIDKDGTRELILTDSKDAFLAEDEEAIVVGFVNNKVKIIRKFNYLGGGKLYYSDSKKALSWYARLAGEYAVQPYKYASGKLKKLNTSFEWYAANHDPNDTDNKSETYYISGKKCKKAKYTKSSKKYFKNSMSVKYKKF